MFKTSLRVSKISYYKEISNMFKTCLKDIKKTFKRRLKHVRNMLEASFKFILFRSTYKTL